MNRNSAQERSRALLGAAAMDFLASCHVAVFGLGGVGGHAVMALARGGVGELTLVDKDIVEASNLNRQAAAGVSTLGQQKATVMARKALDVAPWALVHPLSLIHI